MKPSLLILISVLLPIAGCLTVKEKEYTIRLTTGQSGEATIRFVDIGSASDDSADVTEEDFKHLIDFYINGTGIEEENPGLRNVRKRLFEDNGVLCGELAFEFDSLSAVRLFRYDKDSPFMYYVGPEVFSEQLVETNGALGGEQMPVIFWPKKTREFAIRTRILSDASYRKSLLTLFHHWEGRRSLPDRGEEQ